VLDRHTGPSGTEPPAGSKGLDDLGKPPEAGPTTSEQLGIGPEIPFTIADRLGLIAERIDEWRERPFLVVAAAAAFVGLALVVPRFFESDASDPPIEDRIPQVTLTPTSAPVGTSTVFVHVSGAVQSPGVYTLDATARVVDAVEAAGGATADGEVHLLNLAALVVDGQQIRVPVEGETVVPSAPSESGPIDINGADVIALQSLPGVGPATAEAIVAHREENGPFRSIDDLLDVPGIGPAKLATIADAAVVR